MLATGVEPSPGTCDTFFECHNGPAVGVEDWFSDLPLLVYAPGAPPRSQRSGPERVGTIPVDRERLAGPGAQASRATAPPPRS